MPDLSREIFCIIPEDSVTKLKRDAKFRKQKELVHKLKHHDDDDDDDDDHGDIEELRDEIKVLTGEINQRQSHDEELNLRRASEFLNYNNVYAKAWLLRG